MDIVEEKQPALGPAGHRSVNSLATTVAIVQETLHRSDSSLSQKQVSKADTETSFCHPAAACHYWEPLKLQPAASADQPIYSHYSHLYSIQLHTNVKRKKKHFYDGHFLKLLNKLPGGSSAHKNNMIKNLILS